MTDGYSLGPGRVFSHVKTAWVHFGDPFARTVTLVWIIVSLTSGYGEAALWVASIAYFAVEIRRTFDDDL